MPDTLLTRRATVTRGPAPHRPDWPAPPVGAAEDTLTERAYRTFEEAIVTLELRPGEAVSEAQLAARFGFGRTPVREALQRLARERLVRILPRRGVVVAPVDVGEQLRLLEVRREIERLCARVAARRADADQRAQLRDVAEGMERCGEAQDETSFLRLDRTLHLLVLEAARNEFAGATMELMHGLSRRFWFIHWRRNADLRDAALVHAALARAIADARSEDAAAASDRLLDYIDHFTRATVGPDT